MSEKDSAGHAAHDAWCADDDWYELSDEERAQWEISGQAARSWDR